VAAVRAAARVRPGLLAAGRALSHVTRQALAPVARGDLADDGVADDVGGDLVAGGVPLAAGEDPDLASVRLPPSGDSLGFVGAVSRPAA
jgi:hypothetical protein